MPLPRHGGALGGFSASTSAPTLGPRSAGGSHSSRLVLLSRLGQHGARTLYLLPPPSVTRPASRGSTFGPGLGRPIPKRFPEPPLLTARAFSTSPLPAVHSYKQSAGPRALFGRQPPMLGRTDPQQWDQRGILDLYHRRTYLRAGDLRGTTRRGPLKLSSSASSLTASLTASYASSASSYERELQSPAESALPSEDTR
jgi:hypothetical protein